MSVPAAKALSPAPVRIRTLIERSVVDARADLGQPLVHREGEGVARLRPVEGDAGDAVADLVEDVLADVARRCRLAPSLQCWP